MVVQGCHDAAVEQPSDRLLDAVVDLLVAGGYEGISIRRVAAAAGVSIGAVQHHFPTKDALLAAAMDRVGRAFRDRLAARVPVDATPAAALREVAHELLAADPDQRRDAVVWVVTVARAAVDEPTALAHRAEWQEVEDVLARLLGAARPDLAPADARDRATVLLALLDGLATALAVEPGRVVPARALALVDAHLDALLDPDPLPVRTLSAGGASTPSS